MSTPPLRKHPDDNQVIEMLIGARILSPAARYMSSEAIAEQHNGANALDQTDPLFLDPTAPLVDQVDRIITAHLEN